MIENSKNHDIHDTMSTAQRNVTTLHFVHHCKSVVWRWVFAGVGAGKYKVAGFTLEVDTSIGKVITVYVDFHSLTWAIDTGFNVTAPASYSKRT